MRKQIVMALLMGFTLSANAQKTTVSKAVAELEKTFAAQTPQALGKDKAFVEKVRKVVAKGNADAANLIANHGTFIFVNGMLEDVEKSLAKMSPEVKKSADGLKTQDQFYRMRSLEVGEKVPDFTLPAPDGREITFYQFLKGKKCVLLDFWASWCHWCRKESPNVQKVYDTYRGADFDVISVSFDTKESDWKKAIADDKNTWTQVADLEGTKGTVYAWYDLNGIPAIFLIDGEGRILAKALRGAAIEEAVKGKLGK